MKGVWVEQNPKPNKLSGQGAEVVTVAVVVEALELEHHVHICGVKHQVVFGGREKRGV